MASIAPWALLLGFAGFVILLFGDRLFSAPDVQVETVVTTRPMAGGVDAAQSRVGDGDRWDAPHLFQASGWIEPDPLPVKATALVSGVVETLEVLEGESVTEGQLLATLIREDFELDLSTAQSELAGLQAEAAAHESAIHVAEAKIKTLEKQVSAGRMKCAELDDRLQRLTKAGAAAVSEEDRTQAQLRLRTHSSEVDALAASGMELESELARLHAGRAKFAAQIQRAETEVARRELALRRTEIRSPVDGIVLRRLAVPGQKRMLEMDDPDSATVAILYQPDQLQARIDVPLEEASQLSVGQLVRLRSNFLPDTMFQGVVTRIVGEADLQRNTLQAKVRVTNPDRRLRPDMLCRAEFLAVSGESPSTGAAGRVAVFVPEGALINDSTSQSQAEVWTLDDSGKLLELRAIELGRERRDGHVLVLDGLLPGDRVVVNPAPDLEEGDRVNPILHSN